MDELKVEKKEAYKVCLYCRVSTGRQELFQQIEACKRFCEYKELEIVDIYQEVGSGKSFNRPFFYKMLVALRKMKYQGIVVFRIDRLGRSVLDLANFLSEMDNKGIKVFSVNENLDRSSAIGKLTVNIILSMAQFERESISEATKQRLAAIKKGGKTLGRPVGVKDRKKRKRKVFRLSKQGGGF